jgi:tRNA1(Val) A37 N6-methylase TrmN6
MVNEARKSSGSYYTPDAIVSSLVSWAVRRANDRLLDPSCGDGRFLSLHRNSVGVEMDFGAAKLAIERAPSAMIHKGDFFKWASETEERFDAAAGNPPFIRYQRFNGDVRNGALRLCAGLGAEFSSLASSWAPFLVATASLLHRGGRMAFVVPAEIGHAPYAVPLLEFFARNFESVQIVAVCDKLFEELSEDCWLLYAEGFGGSTDHFRFSPLSTFKHMAAPPTSGMNVTLPEWRDWNSRLRPFLMSKLSREVYRHIADGPGGSRLGTVARVGIGYVTGANDFFHLRPSAAEKFGIPDRFLHPSVRNGRALNGESITLSTVKRWLLADEPVLLLSLKKARELPDSVNRYLKTQQAQSAMEAYKCRMRDPWYVVPDVTMPDGFLSYMSGAGVSLVSNRAQCVCTNSVHAVNMTGKMLLSEAQRRWKDPIAKLSCEVEGHPLGGGMLKVEPREAARLVLADRRSSKTDDAAILAGISEMRNWRHYGKVAEEAG